MDKMTNVSQTTNNSTGAYSSGDLVGGKMTFDMSALRGDNGEVVLDSVMVQDKSTQGADLDLVLFTQDISTETTLTDNSAFAPADADLANVAAVVSLTSHAAFSASGVSQVNDLKKPIKFGGPNDDMKLYGVLVSRGTPTYSGSTNELTVNLAARG